jgi:hypothetical protein
MNALFILAGLVLAGAGLFYLLWWIERYTRRPGLALLVGGILLLVGALTGLSAGQRVLPLIFVAQSACFFYLAHWKRSSAARQGDGK